MESSGYFPNQHVVDIDDGSRKIFCISHSLGEEISVLLLLILLLLGVANCIIRFHGICRLVLRRYCQNVGFPLRRGKAWLCRDYAEVFELSVNTGIIGPYISVSVTITRSADNSRPIFLNNKHNADKYQSKIQSVCIALF